MIVSLVFVSRAFRQHDGAFHLIRAENHFQTIAKSRSDPFNESPAITAIEINFWFQFSLETVKLRVRHIMEKLAAADRAEAVSTALRRGIMSPKMRKIFNRCGQLHPDCLNAGERRQTTRKGE
jgi:hypothetical protein